LYVKILKGLIAPHSQLYIPPFSIPMPKPTTHQAILRLIDRSADEGWEALDLPEMGLEELPIGQFTGLAY
jgi:hypothetical protein